MSILMDDLLAALAHAPVLAGLSEGALGLIAEEGLAHDVAAGDYIVHEGEMGHAFYLLTFGEVEVVKRGNGSGEVPLCTLAQGEFFGEMCILAPMPRAASIRAVGQVRVLEVKAATLHHLYKKMPEQYAILLLNLARDLARRLSRLDEAFIARAG